MAEDDFKFEYSSGLPQEDGTLRIEAEQQLRRLAEGHRDLVGASVDLSPGVDAATLYMVRARVVVYMSPDNLVAVEHDASPHQALLAALRVVERHVRESRGKLRERWRQ